MTTPMEAYKQLILQDTNADPVFGVHKISEKTNYRWKAGFLAGYAAGQREALLDAMQVCLKAKDNFPMMSASADNAYFLLSRKAKELE